MLVEDEPSTANIERIALDYAGGEVLVAKDGDAALKRMCETDRIDLLISDLIMPGSISEEKLLVWARERYPNMSRLLISGYADYIPAGHRFFAKSFSLLELKDAVQAELEQSGRVRQPIDQSP